MLWHSSNLPTRRAWRRGRSGNGRSWLIRRFGFILVAAVRASWCWCWSNIVGFGAARAAARRTSRGCSNSSIGRCRGILLSSGAHRRELCNEYPSLDLLRKASPKNHRTCSNNSNRHTQRTTTSSRRFHKEETLVALLSCKSEGQETTCLDPVISKQLHISVVPLLKQRRGCHGALIGVRMDGESASEQL